MIDKKITRTFTTFKVVVKDAETKEVLKEEVSLLKITKQKVAVAFIKETGNTSFIVEITEESVLREMSVETFIKNSSVVVPKPEVIAEV